MSIYSFSPHLWNIKFPIVEHLSKSDTSTVEGHFQRVSFGKSFETISKGYHLAILLRPFPEGVKTFETISKAYVLL